METISEARSRIINSLQKIYDLNESRNIAKIALGEVLGLDAIHLNLQSNDVISAESAAKINVILRKLIRGMPIQYIKGQTEFYGCRILVNRNTLIPRPETEEMVNIITQKLIPKKNDCINILDICTGSGCIAIALKNTFPFAFVTGLDLYEKTLETALENARINKTEIRFLKCDVLKGDLKNLDLEKMDIIVSNPPYVTEKDKKQMKTNVLDYEPPEALFAPFNSPLAFYDHISEFAAENLSKNGCLFFEINEAMGYKVRELIKSKGFSSAEIIKDFYGKDRIVHASL